MSPAGETSAGLTWREIATAPRHVLEAFVRQHRPGLGAAARRTAHRTCHDAERPVVLTQASHRPDTPGVDLVSSGDLVAHVPDRRPATQQIAVPDPGLVVVDRPGAHAGPAAQARFLETAARSGLAVVSPGVTGVVRSLLGPGVGTSLAEEAPEETDVDEYRRRLWRAAQAEHVDDVQVVLVVRAVDEHDVRSARAASDGAQRLERVVVISTPDSSGEVLRHASLAWGCPVDVVTSDEDACSALSVGHGAPVVLLDGACGYPRGFVEDLAVAWSASKRVDVVATSRHVFLEDLGASAVLSGCPEDRSRVNGMFSVAGAQALLAPERHVPATSVDARRLPLVVEFPSYSERATWGALVSDGRASRVQAILTTHGPDAFGAVRPAAAPTSWFDRQDVLQPAGV